MLHHLENSEIDRVKWDNAIDNCLTPLPYAYSWYLDLACSGWEAIADDDYKNIMPLPWRKKGGIKYLYQPSFTQQFGIFQYENNESIITEALALVKKIFRYAEFQVNYTNHFDSINLQFKQRTNFHLSLDKPYEVIKKGYNNNLRRNLQKASAQPFEIIKTSDATDLIKIFKETKGNLVKELKKTDYDRLQMICKTACEKNYGNIYTAKLKGEIRAAAFFLINHKYIINLFPASTNAGKENFAMPFLLDTIIRENSPSGKILDFEGSDIPSVAQFYKGFGPVEVPYHKIWINQLPWYLRLVKNIKNGL